MHISALLRALCAHHSVPTLQTHGLQVANVAREIVLLGKADAKLPTNRVANRESKKKKKKAGDVDSGPQRARGPDDQAPFDLDLAAGADGDSDDPGGQRDATVLELDDSEEDVHALGGNSDEGEEGSAAAPPRRTRARKRPPPSRQAGADIDGADEPPAAGRAARKRTAPRRYQSDEGEAGGLSGSGDDQDLEAQFAPAPKGPTTKSLDDTARRDARDLYLSNHALNAEAIAPFKLTPADVARTASRFAALCDVAPPETFERNKIPRQHTKTFKSASWKRYVRYDGDVYCLRKIYPPATLRCIRQINGVLRLALHGDHNREVPDGLTLAAVRAVSAYERILPPSQNLMQNHVIIHLVPIACNVRLARLSLVPITDWRIKSAI